LIPVAVAVALALASCREAPAERRPEKAKAQLHLLTALPLLWAEDFGLDQSGSPVIERLERDYRVTPVDLPSQLPEHGLLLAAQPRALPAEELVELDAWVRRGGRLVLLADPRLEWPSKRPVGDPLRAPFAYPDTGLLQHWGLRLDAPDQRGVVRVTLGGKAIATASPGSLVRTRGACRVTESGLVANCAIGSGHATIIADADFLNVDWEGLEGSAAGNLPALLSQLDSLSR
jgi:hypothetical protein